jgi:subtilisin family serine protease
MPLPRSNVPTTALLDLVRLPGLMLLTAGKSEIAIALIDGPVAVGHPHLAQESIQDLTGAPATACRAPGGAACLHGTLVAGVLVAQRTSAAPAICPGCRLLVRPIFVEAPSTHGHMPAATFDELASAVWEALEAGARVINLSAAPGSPSARGEQQVREALDEAAARGTLVVAAAGNAGSLASSVITRHPWVIPVVACDVEGRLLSWSNLGTSIGKHGLRAPGDGVVSLGTDAASATFSGTSAAAPFVTGTIALLWSLFPAASAAQVRRSIARAHGRRVAVVPPLLDAWSAYEAMSRDVEE